MSAPTDPTRRDFPLPPFGVNEVRLDWRQWLAALGIFAVLAAALPRVWSRLEAFEAKTDYRIPYSLSRDYWLYHQRVRNLTEPDAVAVLGDSVVWGEYVLPDGTLSHFLDRAAGQTNRFVNVGVNGLFPLALEGLAHRYAPAFAHRRVIVHCNLLWMTSPKADLSTDKEESFNHSRLVPQFTPRIPCYRADASERLGATIEAHSGFLQWVGHLENVYFDQKSIPRWTLAEDSSDPPRYTNAFRNPLAQLHLQVPSPFGPDPDRGPASPRHRPWNRAGSRTVEFDWVEPRASLQWAAFRRCLRRLRDAGSDVFVVVGPFNEAMLSDANRAVFHRWRDHVDTWLKEQGLPHAVPEALPAELYADASHPLTDGYALLAQRLWSGTDFREWLAHDPAKPASSSPRLP